MRALGARSVPVVARGERFVYAQVMRDVVEFLGLDESTAPELSPEALAARMDRVLETAIRLVRQMPDAEIERQLPNRPRAWRVLMHHVFQIPAAFLQMEATGKRLEYEVLVAEPPDSMRTSVAIADFGETVRIKFSAWWQGVRNESFAGQVPVYFGATTRHEMFERTVWHSAQHVRQIAALLTQLNIAADRPLSAEDIRGLPLTDKIWDEG